MNRIMYSYAEAFAKKYCTDVCMHYENETKTNLKVLAQKVSEEQLNTNSDDYAKYILTIVDKYEDIIALKANEFESYKNTHFNFPNLNLSETNWISSGEKFYEKIKSIMKYSTIRKREYAEAIKNMEIRTCVYCNLEYLPVVLIDDENTEHNEDEQEHVEDGENAFDYRCHFEADHFFPESEYPFLCISFYNLIPSCPFCNKGKSARKASFYLYTDNDEEISPFKFELTEMSLAKYICSHKSKDLKLSFKSSKSDFDNLLKNHNNLFHIDKLCNYFKKEAEEIIWKAETMNEAYVTQLMEAFGRIFSDLKEEQIRFMYGFYDKKENIHKQPLTKMKQDIAKQLGILK